ncbi:hypothetical protein STXM2123_1845 [Streptomyces sp. F-3]|nr:hypothetical protein STXM2123_1845 [Streptomyces sp. F-3]
MSAFRHGSPAKDAAGTSHDVLFVPVPGRPFEDGGNDSDHALGS